MSIARAFDRADAYDRHAGIQRTVANRLADHILALPLPTAPRVLEIGCGTGFLGAALVDRLPGAHWLMTDISPAMLERARARFAGHSGMDFAVMDGGDPDRDGPFDLICSSLAMQWFADLGAAVARLRARLAPGGHLTFTTLARGSFAQWRAAHGALSAGTPDYPEARTLAGYGLEVAIETHKVHHAGAREFLHDVKAIGAGTPRPGHRPLNPAEMRAVMRRFEAGGAIADYVVATCTAHKALS